MPRPTKKTVKSTAETTVEDTAEEEQVEVKPVKSRLVANSCKFDIFAKGEQMQQTKDLLAKAKISAGFKTASELNRDYLPVPWLAFQYLLGCIGIPVNTIVEFMGRENTGKSSVVMALLGNFITYNIPCLYINTEPKSLESDWISRLVGTDRDMSKRVKDVLEVAENVYTLDEIDSLVRRWIVIKRVEQCIPKDVPLVIAVDSITSPLNPEEAEALLGVSTDKKMTAATKKKLAETINGVGDVSRKPGVTAKWLAAWCRSMKSLLESSNVTLICVSGTNANMAPSTGAFGPEGGDSLNKERIGGTALNKATAFQITFVRKGMLKKSDGTAEVGETIKARVVKSSYSGKRKIEYDLRNDDFKDSHTTMQQALCMDQTFCNIMVSNNLFGLTCKAKKYTSEELGLYQVSAAVLYAKVANNPDLVLKAAQALQIHGYEGLDS